MPTTITADDLERIFTRWDRYDLPSGVKDKTFELSMKAVDKIFEMISLIGSFDENTAFALGEKIGEVVTRPFVLCYYIGYDLASGKMSRANGTPYLMAATQPIQDYVLEIVKILAVKEINNLEALRSRSLEVSKLVGEASNDICVLGIENFRRIGYK